MRFIVLTEYGWIAVTNALTGMEAISLVRKYLPDAAISRAVNLEQECFDSRIANETGLFEALLNQGKAVDPCMEWDPTEYLKQPLRR